MSAKKKANPWRTAGDGKNRYTITVGDEVNSSVQELKVEYGLKSDSATVRLILEDYFKDLEERKKAKTKKQKGE